MSIFNSIVETASNAWQYINDNEWAANALSGAAGAGLDYLVQQDSQQHQERLARMQNDWQNERFYAQSPGMAGGAGGSYGSLTRGLLTQREVK